MRGNSGGGVNFDNLTFSLKQEETSLVNRGIISNADNSSWIVTVDPTKIYLITSLQSTGEYYQYDANSFAINRTALVANGKVIISRGFEQYYNIPAGQYANRTIEGGSITLYSTNKIKVPFNFAPNYRYSHIAIYESN